jgi:VWFA-related protein
MSAARRDSKLWTALGLTLALAAAGVAQEPAAESNTPPPATVDDGTAETEEGVFFETVDVNLVNVQVFVTDKKGNPISGLGVDDFEIYEDKRPVKISNFFAVEGRQPVVGSADTPPPVDPSAPEKLEALAEDQQLHLVVYVDNFNIRPFNRNRVFTRLREFLSRKLQRGDRVMLVTYDRTLHYRHPFTSSPDLIASALFDLEKLTGHALGYDSEHRELMREIEEAQGYNQVGFRVQQFAQSRYNDMTFALDALREVVDSLAGLQGRKALLYVSDGLPMTPAEDLFHALQHKFQDASVLSRMRDYDLSRKFTRLTDAANTNETTFYTIDAAGLRIGFSTTAESSRHGSTPGLWQVAESIQTNNLQSPLLFMARRTGGTAIYNTNDIGNGLTRVATDLGTYYSLGYLPGHSGDGRFHKIEVKVKRKGLRVRHRYGYRDKPLPARMADGTMSTLRYGFERNPLGIALRVGGQQSHERGNYLVDLVVVIPIGKVTLVPRQRFHEARVKLFVAAMDDEGGVAEVQEELVPIRIPLGEIEQARGTNFNYAMRLLMRPGGHRVAIGIRDEIGAETSFIAEVIQVGA